MTKQIINLGTPDKGNGDPLRVAFAKVNGNFDELYTLLSEASLTELAQDYAAAMFTNGTHIGITVAYNDDLNKINLTVANQSWAQITGKPTIPTDVSQLTDTTNIIPNEYVLPIASGTILGGVKVGANLTIDGNGVLAAGNSYVLPTATDTVLGGVKVGANLTITDGVLSAGDPYDHGNITITGVDQQTITGNVVDGNIQLTPNGLGTVVVNSDLHMVSGTEFSIGGAMMTATDGQFELDSDIVPAQNNTVSLGTTDLRWKEVWIGPGTLVITDETMGTDVVVTARDNNFVVEGTAGLKVGSFEFNNNALTFGDPIADISIGLPESTGVIKFNRGVEIISGDTGLVTFSATREGLVTHRAPNFGPTEAALSINSSVSGAAQTPTNRGTMLQITGIEDMPNRISADAYGFGLGGNAYINFAARAARGTSEFPTATQADDLLFRLSANGWGDTDFASVTQGICQINFLANENFTDSIHGTRIEVRTTETGQGTGRVNTIFNSTGIVLPDASNGLTFGDSTRQTTAWLETVDALTQITNLQSVATSGDYRDLSFTPTALSEFSNDLNFISSTDSLIAGANTLSLSSSTGWLTFPDSSVQKTAWTGSSADATFGHIRIHDDTIENTVLNHNIDIATNAQTGDISLYAKEFHVYTVSGSEPSFSVSTDGNTRILAPTFNTALGAFDVVGSSTGDVVPPVLAGVMVHVTGQDSTPSRVYNDGNNAYSGFFARRFNGTAASPTGVLSGEVSGRFATNVYTSNDEWTPISTARIDFVATENQTATATGNEIQFWTTTPGTTDIAKHLAIDYTGIKLYSGITFSDSTVQTTAAIPLTQKGVANGVASLGSDGRVPSTQLPAGATLFKGGWDASTDTPDLGDNLPAGVQAGWEYIVTVGGTRDIGNGTETFSAGDLVIYDGANWVRIPAGDSGVSTFNGRSDAVTLTSLDVTSALTYTPYNSTNPAAYVNAGQAAAAAPVQLVFGRAGNVTLTSADVTGALTSGSIANVKLANDSVIIGTTEIDLGATSLTLAGLTSVSATTLTGTLSTAAQTNITSVGTLSNLTVTGTTTSGSLITNADTSASSNKGAISHGTLSYSDTGIFGSFSSSNTGYNQVILQNTSNGTGASTNVIVSNNLGTATTNYGQLGMNSSTFTGTGSLNLAGAVYLTAATTDLVIGTNDANAIHFVVNNGTTDALTISSAGVATFANIISGSITGNAGTATNGVVTTGSYTDPAWLTLTKSKVGLGNVDNTSDANKPISTATQTALNLKANIASPTFTGTVSGITAAMVGLGNVDNTSDANKPISTATQTALNLKAPIDNPTFTGTVGGITKAMVGLGNVENTALSTWAGSTNITTVGTLATLTVTAPITGSVTGNAGTVTNGVYTTDNGTVTNTMLAGNIANAKLVNSAVSVNTSTGLSGGGSVALGGSITLTNTDTGSAQAIFKNIAVAGQTTVTSTINNDTATFVAGTNMTITTSGKNITFNATGSAGGVTSLAAGNNIILSGPTGAVTIQRVDGLQSVVTGNSGSTYNLALTDQYFGTTRPSSGATTVTLPLGANVPVGRQFVIKDEAGNAGAGGRSITITRSGSDLIDGNTTRVINSNYGSLTVMWTGTHWSRI